MIVDIWVYSGDEIQSYDDVISLRGIRCHCARLLFGAIPQFVMAHIYSFILQGISKPITRTEPGFTPVSQHKIAVVYGNLMNVS